jgi:chorismate mutase/prephenate dehydratase
MSTRRTLEQIRAEIDALDKELHTLLNRRAGLALEVAAVKSDSTEDPVLYRPEREAQILREVARRNPGPLADETVCRLFREVMSACLALEEPLTVAYLGPPGTFTQEAALKHFGHAVAATPLATIDAVFRTVEAGTAAFGVVPVENSTEGVVNHTLDMFIASPLGICGEVELRVHHQLLSQEAELASIERVYAHRQALAQCREWLQSQLRDVITEAVNSNAEAAQLAAQQSATAAIASAWAGEHYALNTLAANIEDKPDNTTRFLVIGTQEITASGEDKTSLLLSARNRPGALYGLLAPLAQAGISMTKIESRPSHLGKWEYVFYIDIEGHREDQPLRDVLSKLEADAALFRVLGSYPRVAR